MENIYLGYHFTNGRYSQGQRLEGITDLVAFLKEHLYKDEIRATDLQDNLIFHARDGVDLYSRLEEIGINLQAIYREIRTSWQGDRPELIKEP